MKPKKGQVKMFETVAVLVVFFFLIAISLVFFFVFQQAETEKTVQKEFQRRAIETAQRMATLPELDCVKTGIQIENCFDALKVTAFAQVMQDGGPATAQDYFPILGFSTISVQQLYPKTEEPVVIYDNKLEERGYDVTQIPILLLDPVSNSFKFALLEVKMYE